MMNNMNNNMHYQYYQQMPYNYLYNPMYNQQSNNGSSYLSQYQQTQAGHAQNNIIWISGKDNAKSIQLQPNSSVILLDNEENKFYIKTTDNIGLSKTRTFNYTEEIDDSQQQIQEPEMSNYITRQQFQNTIKLLKGEKLNNEQSISTIKQQPIIIKK